MAPWHLCLSVWFVSDPTYSVYMRAQKFKPGRVIEGALQDMDVVYDALSPLSQLRALHVINKALPYKTVAEGHGKQKFKPLQGNTELLNTVLEASSGMTKLHTLELVDQFSMATISRWVFYLCNHTKSERTTKEIQVKFNLDVCQCAFTECLVLGYSIQYKTPKHLEPTCLHITRWMVEVNSSTDCFIDDEINDILVLCINQQHCHHNLRWLCSSV